MPAGRPGTPIPCDCGDPDCEVVVSLPTERAKEVKRDDAIIVVSPSCLDKARHRGEVIEQTATYALIKLPGVQTKESVVGQRIKAEVARLSRRRRKSPG